MLEVLVVTDITSEFRAVVHGMLLQLTHRLPDYLSSFSLVAFVRKLAEINAVSQYLVDLLHEVTSCLTVRAADIVSRSGSSTWSFFLRALSLVRASILLSSIATHQLYLTVLAEQLIALLTFQRLVWEVVAHDALDFLYHFALQLVLDF